jgi:hypothetical protein
MICPNCENQFDERVLGKDGGFCPNCKRIILIDEKDEVELKEVPSNPIVDFSEYDTIFKDTHKHLPAFELIDTELGLQGENYYPLKKEIAYRVESIRQKATRYYIGGEVSDNRIHFLVMAGAGRGKGQIKKVLMKLDHYDEEIDNIYEKPMSFELPATRLNLEQLAGKLEIIKKKEPDEVGFNQLTGKKIILKKVEKITEEKENPGILSYRQIIADECADLICETKESYEAIMLDVRKSMDTFGDNKLDKRQVDNKNQLRYPIPSRWCFLSHITVLPARYFDRGTYRRVTAFHIVAPQISEDAAYNIFYRESKEDKLREYINTESFEIENLQFNIEAIDELTLWIRTWNRFVINHPNRKIRAIGQRCFVSVRHYFLKHISVLAITNGAATVTPEIVKQACFDTVQFLLQTFSCYANDSNVNLSRDIWGTEDPRKAEVLEWMFYNQALNEESSLSIEQVQEKIVDSFGLSDRTARGIFAEMLRDSLIVSKKGRDYSKCWLAFTPKAEGIVLVADKTPIDLKSFLALSFL